MCLRIKEISNIEILFCLYDVFSEMLYTHKTTFEGNEVSIDILDTSNDVSTLNLVAYTSLNNDVGTDNDYNHDYDTDNVVYSREEKNN